MQLFVKLNPASKSRLRSSYYTHDIHDAMIHPMQYEMQLYITYTLCHKRTNNKINGSHKIARKLANGKWELVRELMQCEQRKRTN